MNPPRDERGSQRRGWAPTQQPEPIPPASRRARPGREQPPAVKPDQRDPRRPAPPLTRMPPPGGGPRNTRDQRGHNRGNQDRLAYSEQPIPKPISADVTPQRPPKRTGAHRPDGPPPDGRTYRQVHTAESLRPRRTRGGRRRRMPILRTLLVVVALLIASTIGFGFYLNSKLNHIAAFTYPNRIADTPGENWLLVGSDSRVGLTPAQQRQLATGGNTGPAHTDTIMMVHIPASGGKPMLISIPRDLFVQVPGVGGYKINAAYAIGQAPLLIQTVETVTGVHIDHYAEIGFGGFDKVVDSIGGITMCIKEPLTDPKAGLRLKAGCQKLNGKQALGYVRSRAFPQADLERVVHQREFLQALLKKASSPSTYLNPFRLVPFAESAVSTIQVGPHDNLWQLGQLALALADSPITTTAPTGGSYSTSDGDALKFDSSSKEFFNDIANDRPIPQRLLRINSIVGS